MFAQTAGPWRSTLTTSSSRTPTVPAPSSWITWLQMTLASTCASPPALLETPAPWARLQSRVGIRIHVLVYIQIKMKWNHSCFLSVFAFVVPPRFVHKLRNAVFVAGEDAQFTCTIISAPSPKIRYSFAYFCCRMFVFFPNTPCVSPLQIVFFFSSLFRWFKEGRLLADQEKYQTYSEPRSGVVVFVIKNPGEKDLGRYECEVRYRIGITFVSCYVKCCE